jgi:hypothetical protein
MKPRPKIRERKLGGRVWGNAYHGENLIEVDPRQRSRTRLDTVIHEILHLLAPDWSETKVKKSAREIARLLWGDRWRRVSK